MASARDPRTGQWFFRKWVKLPTGQRQRLFGSPFDTKKKADDAERIAVLQSGQPVKVEVPTFHDWFHGRFWREWVEGGARKNSPSEQEAKRSIYRVHLGDYFGAVKLDRIDAAMINAFRASKRDGVKSEKTLNNILAVLSKPLTYAAKVGVIDRAPAVGVAKVERPEPEFLELEQVAALVASAAVDRQPEYLVAMLLAVEAGMRIGEIKALQWEHVDMRAKTITVAISVRPVKGTNGKIVDVFGPPKGRVRRTVQVSPALHDALRHRLPRTGFVVPGDDGHKHTQETRSAMERISKRAGLAIGGEWHVLRHTFATHAAMLGCNPWRLNQWMGHARMEETMLYVSLAGSHRRDIPAEMMRVGEGVADPDLRILAMLSARTKLSWAADGQRAKLKMRKSK